MTSTNPMAMPDPMPEASFDPWNFRPDVAVELGGGRAGGWLAGYKVEAVDGTVGKVADASLVPEHSYLVVAKGSRVFGRNIMLPAGTVNHIDRSEHRIYVDRTRDQIKHAPDVPAEGYDDSSHRNEVAGYYRDTYHARI